MVGEVTALHGLLERARATAVFTGAGVSTESGIPDFRSPGGIWTRYDPRELTFQRYVESADTRRMSWAMRRELIEAHPTPNAAHRAIADLELSGRSPGVITQNIDGLHTMAGSMTVVEIHGTFRTVMCIGHRPVHGAPEGCGWTAPSGWAFDQIDAGEDDPDCPGCGGLVKSATISFGQMMDERSLTAAIDMVHDADALLVVGSSLQVHPAAGLVDLAAERGIPIAIVNREATPYDDVAEVIVRGQAAQVLPVAVG